MLCQVVVLHIHEPITHISESFLQVATVGVTGARESVNSRVQSLLQEIKEVLNLISFFLSFFLYAICLQHIKDRS